MEDGERRANHIDPKRQVEGSIPSAPFDENNFFCPITGVLHCDCISCQIADEALAEIREEDYGSPE